VNGARPGPIEVRAQVACFEEDRLLCARHRKRGETYFVLPGGHVEPGETLAEAARREMKEETGIETGGLRPWALGEFLSSRRHVLDFTFVASEWEGDPRLGSDPEAAGGAASLTGLVWLDRTGLGRSPFRPVLLRDHLLRRWMEREAPLTYLGVERA